jgi:tyrosyl-tRNA synthetase
MTAAPRSAKEQFDYLIGGCIDVVRGDELLARLTASVEKGRPLVVKTGFDPSSADIHLGHVVLIRKMKQFQECGHDVVFVVGDFTAMIGDPTGRSKTRPQLTREEILANAETYRRQATKILDPARTRFSHNSEWLDALGAPGMIRLAAKYNVARMLERRDFRQRYDAGQSIAVHEFLYPLAQAYDSVALKADVELGGTDQLFNLNVGRDIMPEYGLAAQIVMTTPLLEGLDGVQKMSKSLGNYVGIDEAPAEMFGKIMSISDAMMWKYWGLVAGAPDPEITIARTAVEAGILDPVAGREELIAALAARREVPPGEESADSAAILGEDVGSVLETFGASSLHPKELKMALARRVVGDFHGAPAATQAEAEFLKIFSEGHEPTEVEEFVRPLAPDGAWLPKLLAELGLVKSNSEAVRLIQQGGVTVDGTRVDSKDHRLASASPASYLLKVGKRRFARVRFE